MLAWQFTVGAHRITKIHSKLAAVFMVAVALCGTASFTAAQSPEAPAPPAASGSVQPLDYEFFRTRVEPIFLKKRAGHTRCYACHSGGIEPKYHGVAPAYLVRVTPGSDSWTEEQSRANFKMVSRYVIPGKPMSSLLLIHPLAPDAGGHVPPNGILHSGGKQFASQSDPDWQTWAEWARGAKADGSSKR